MSNAKIFLIGDQTGATEFIPVATYFLKKARSEGLSTLNRTFIVEGAEIRIVLDPHTGDRVYIQAVSCAVKISGFMDTFQSPALYESRINKQLADEQRLDFNADGSLKPATHFMGVRAETKPDTLAFADMLPIAATTETTDENGDKVYGIADSTFKDAYEQLYPTKFTGLMRGVMQATYATDYWTAFTSVGGVPAIAPVNYVFGDSWGCVGKNDVYQFIQISGTKVYRVPASTCVHTGKTSTGVSFKAVVLKSMSTKDKVLIGEIPEDLGQPWSNEIGWAFSYGLPKWEASIVVSTEGSNHPKKTSKLTIEFLFDQNNVPTGISFSKTPPKTFWVNRDCTGRYADAFSVLNVPMNIGGNLQNVTVDVGKQYPSEILSDAELRSMVGVPAHVFYTRQGESLCTYNFSYVDSTADTVAQAATDVGKTSAGTNVTDYTPLINQAWYGTKNRQGSMSFRFFCGDIGSIDNGGARNENIYEWISVESLGGGTYTNQQAKHTTAIYYLDYQEPDGTRTVLGPYSGLVIYGRDEYYWLRKRNTIRTGDDVKTVSTLTLPLLDRESVHIRTLVSTSQKTEVTSEETWRADKYDPGQSIGIYNGNTSVTADAAVSAGLAGGSGGLVCDRVSLGAVTITFDGRCSSDFYFSLTGPPLSSAQIYYPKWDSPVISACGYVAYVANPSSQSFAPPPTVNKTIVTDAHSDETCEIFGHGDPISVQSDAIVSLIHPLQAELRYNFAQAVFDPSRYAKHKTVANSAMVVVFDGGVYDVQNQTYGWIGVA